MTNPASGNDPFFMLMLPLSAFLLCAVITGGSASKMPDGSRKKSTVIFFTYCCITLLLFAGRFFNLGVQGDFFLHGLSAFCIVCIPFIYNLLVPDKSRNSPAPGIVPLIIPAAMALPVFLGGEAGGIFFVLFFYTGCGLLVYGIIKRRNTEGFIEEINGSFTGEMLRQIIPVGGITADLIFHGEWQRTPIFSIICTVWLVVEIYRVKVLKERDYKGENLPSLMTPFCLVVCVLLFYGWLNAKLDQIKGAGFSETFRIPLITGTVILGGALYYPVYYGIRKIYLRIKTLFTDDFTADINRMDTYSAPEQISRAVKGHIPGADVKFLYRLPFTKIFIPSPADGKKGASDEPFGYIPPDLFFREIRKTGFSLWTPSNVESYADQHSFYREASKLIESGDILFVGLSDRESTPDVLLVVHCSNGKLIQEHISKLLRLSVRIKPGLMKKRENISPDPSFIQPEVYSAESEQNLYSALKVFFSSNLPIKKFEVFAEETNGTILPVFSGNSETAYADNLSVSDGLIKLETTGKQVVFDPENCILLINIDLDSEKRILSVWMDKKLFLSECGIEDKLEGIVNVATSVLQKIKLFGEIEQHRETMEFLQDKLESAKFRIAEELHDTVAQDIYASRLIIQMLEKQVRENMPDSGGDVDILKSSVSEGLSKIRELIARLRTPGEENNSTSEIVDDLNAFIQRIQSQSDMKILFENSEIIREFEPEKARDIALTIREGVNNAVKHAQAELLRIRLRKCSSGIVLVIADNGIGFDPDEAVGKKSFGIRGIREKCERLGGDLKIRTRHDSGTIVRLNIFKANVYT
ncbi:MAG: histidine kinase [Firmicutes bacterium]|nr:histidine kinase [Bacillota bacterium]